MVDEKEEQYSGLEEEEYHFSDDQVNYEADSDASKISVSGKDKLMTKLARHQRMLIGTLGFIILIGIVYKMVVPANSPTAIDFNPGTANKTSLRVAAPAAVSHSPERRNTSLETPAAPVSISEPPPASSVAAAPPKDLPPAAVQPVEQHPAPPAVQPIEKPADASNIDTLTSSISAASETGQTKPILDKLAVLDQQNSAIMNLLQTEYAQKIADYETQNTMTRGKITELTKRINTLETNLTQLTQMLTGAVNKASHSAGTVGSATAAPAETAANSVTIAPAKPIEPKTLYTVQAIIPGRAWLKSDAGDTLTVAEGDVLKEYGRVTKIDPYDGVVEIDTGSKIITLSYGAGG